MKVHQKFIIFSSFFAAFILVGCSDDPVNPPIEPTIEITAQIDMSELEFGSFVRISYELEVGFEPKSVFIYFTEPGGQLSITGFPGGNMYRDLGPLWETGQWRFFVKATMDDDSEIDTPTISFTVLDTLGSVY